MEQQNSKKLGFINGLVLLVVTIGALFLAGSTVGQAGVVLLSIGTLISFFGFIQSHLIDREQVEALEMQELDRSQPPILGKSLFAGAAEDAYPARNARRQFEKWVVPAFSVLVLLSQVLGLLLVFSQLHGELGGWTLFTQASGSALQIMFFALFMVVLFMMGKYSAGLARMDGQELLRPGASYMLLGSVVCTAVVIAEAASFFGQVWDRGITWVVFAVIAVSALENLVTLVLEIYRPRLDDKKARLLYESRLIGLLGQPGGLISTTTKLLLRKSSFVV